MDIYQCLSHCRGTRQGSPLLPLLFAFALEPLAASVRQSSNIVGLRRSLGEDKIASYADTLLFLGDTSSLNAVMSLIFMVLSQDLKLIGIGRFFNLWTPW